MDAFESVVAEILHRDGFWIRNAFKVELTKEEKRDIGRHSSPRWELDLVAYSARRNELLIVECKSYLDSRGVAFRAFAGRFKLFNEAKLRRVVFGRLRHQMSDLGLIAENTKFVLALACGKIASKSDRDKLQSHFDKMGWMLWDCLWLQEKLREISKGSYENSQISVVSKILLREC